MAVAGVAIIAIIAEVAWVAWVAGMVATVAGRWCLGGLGSLGGGLGLMVGEAVVEEVGELVVFEAPLGVEEEVGWGL